jgi:hypothetical protein
MLNTLDCPDHISETRYFNGKKYRYYDYHMDGSKDNNIEAEKIFFKVCGISYRIVKETDDFGIISLFIVYINTNRASRNVLNTFEININIDSITRNELHTIEIAHPKSRRIFRKSTNKRISIINKKPKIKKTLCKRKLTKAEEEELKELRSNLIGCGRAKIIIHALEETQLLSILEDGFIKGHCERCESCREEFKSALQKCNFNYSVVSLKNWD